MGNVMTPSLRGLGIQLQLQVLESHLERPARMELQGEDSAPRSRGIVEIDAELAVEICPQTASHGDDLVAVPLPRFDVGFARGVPQQPAAVLFVELAPPAGADVGLIAAALSLRERFAAELDAAVLAVG